MNVGLAGDVIEVGGVGKHGSRVKARREGGTPRDDGPP